MKTIVLPFILATTIATRHDLDLDHGIDNKIVPRHLRAFSNGHYERNIRCSSLGENEVEGLNHTMQRLLVNGLSMGNYQHFRNH
ncbi:hypothetical protein Lal_00023517 [Lupinus albus]|nr:hypothetical protein Lal_00023517 [Lupinus albus]